MTRDLSSRTAEMPENETGCGSTPLFFFSQSHIIKRRLDHVLYITGCNRILLDNDGGLLQNRYRKDYAASQFEKWYRVCMGNLGWLSADALQKRKPVFVRPSIFTKTNLLHSVCLIMIIKSSCTTFIKGLDIVIDWWPLKQPQVGYPLYFITIQLLMLVILLLIK